MNTENRKKMILVIDDEPDVRTYLTTLLENNGYDTVSAGDGNDALEKIKDTKPDLITLDISMPEKSGVKFYRELKENPDFSSIPVLVVTGVTGYGRSGSDFEQFLSSRKHVPPPDGFIEKPLDDRDELLQKVSDLI